MRSPILVPMMCILAMCSGDPNRGHPLAGPGALTTAPKQDAGRSAHGANDSGPRTGTGAQTKTDPVAPACRTDGDCPPPGSSNVSSICLRFDDYYRCGPLEPAKVGASCVSDAECGGGNICRPAGAHAGAGASGTSNLVCIRAVACAADAECSAGQVCRTDPAVPTGWLDPTGLVCSTPCRTDVDCAPTEKCESGGHCRGRTCPECPSYFSCSSGSCVIPQCSTDKDCAGGYCVHSARTSTGTCAGSLGVCRPVCF